MSRQRNRQIHWINCYQLNSMIWSINFCRLCSDGIFLFLFDVLNIVYRFQWSSWWQWTTPDRYGTHVNKSIRQCSWTDRSYSTESIGYPKWRSTRRIEIRSDQSIVPTGWFAFTASLMLVTVVGHLYCRNFTTQLSVNIFDHFHWEQRSKIASLTSSSSLFFLVRSHLVFLVLVFLLVSVIWCKKSKRWNRITNNVKRFSTAPRNVCRPMALEWRRKVNEWICSKTDSSFAMSS